MLHVLLWHGCVHENICDTHQFYDVDKLKFQHGLGQSVIDDAMDEWDKRLWASVHV